MHGAPDLTSKKYTDRRRAERRLYPTALAAAIAVSALVHLATLFTVSFDGPPMARYVVDTPPEMIDIAPVMRAYDIVTVDTDVPPIEIQIQERQLLREAERAVIQAPAATVPAFRPPTERRPSAPVRERLQYRAGSIRDVWRPAPPAEPGELSPQERVHTRIATSLDQYNDSIAADAAARERATDWTVADADGGRWGVSPGKIHLGDITLPLPVNFAPSEEMSRRMRDFNEIRTQAALVEGREIFDDRVRAIRERLDAERRAKLAADSAAAAARRGGGN